AGLGLGGIGLLGTTGLSLGRISLRGAAGLGLGGIGPILGAAGLGLVGRGVRVVTGGRGRGAGLGLFGVLGGVGQPLLSGVQVVLADAADGPFDRLHLLAGVGVVDLEVLQVVEEPADLLVEPVGLAGDPVAHLALGHLGVLEVLARGLGDLA